MIRSGILMVLACGASVSGGPVRAAYDPVFDDGFDCRLWFTDADGDGFGVAGTGLLTCAPPPGTAPRADDCDDGDPLANPVALDRPDLDYGDANCDGFDGDAERAIHVALTGIDDAACGPRGQPCRSVPFALGQRSRQRPDLYVQQGTYVGPWLLVPPPFGGVYGVYGGFRADWTRAPGEITRVLGNPFASAGLNTLAVAIDGGLLDLGGLRITVLPASGVHADGAGRSAIGVIARGAIVTAFDLSMGIGAGANGNAGTSGSGTTAAAPGGAQGGAASSGSACSTTPGGLGGAAGSNPQCPASSAGGAGGRGGASDTSCDPPFSFDFTALPGQRGDDAALVTGVAGFGGAGGLGGSSCSDTGDGRSGAVGLNGTGGVGGMGGTIVGTTFRFWAGTRGTAGSVGTHGGGGGGGGGAGGCGNAGALLNIRGAGGGGGGAGGCAAPTAGSGGSGGGASIGWFADGGSLELRGSTITTGVGGRGGNGGAGAPGQPGGASGAGGLASGQSPGGGEAGGNGGVGGDGGDSAGGGGGAGGLSAGVVSLFATVVTSGNTFSLGAGGSGGAGGSAAGTPSGGAGAPGVSVPVRTCTAPTGC